MGLTVGRAQVSPKHANFLVALPDGQRHRGARRRGEAPRPPADRS
jgi:hypothetical protein